MKRSDDCRYTLYLEYLGGLIPLLRGKRASKLRPEFIIYDPKLRNNQNKNGKKRRLIFYLVFFVIWLKTNSPSFC